MPFPLFRVVCFGTAEQRGQVVIHQFADAFNGEVRRRIIGNGFGIQCVMALAREDGGERGRGVERLGRIAIPGNLKGCEKLAGG